MQSADLLASVLKPLFDSRTVIFGPRRLEREREGDAKHLGTRWPIAGREMAPARAMRWLIYYRGQQHRGAFAPLLIARR